MKFYFDLEERLMKRVCIETPDEERAADRLSRLYRTDAITIKSYPLC